MADFSVEQIGDDPEDLANKLSSSGITLKSEVNDALMETAEEIKAEIEETAPVDTGAYEGSWYIEPIAEDEVWVLSSGDEAEHNKYLMLPNQNFVGSSGADLPAQGIYHNVEGIAKRHQKQMNTSVADKIGRFLKSLQND